MKIGVFDSGVGGLSVAQAIEAALPEHEVHFVNDQANVPYGLKTIDQLEALVKPIFKRMIVDGCDVIVIACNTVSTLLADRLRETFDTPFVALEPMVKPAAQLSRSKTIAVCATPATLQSSRYAELKQRFASNCQVVEPDCSEWAGLIETNQTDRQFITDTIESVVAKGADVIVLGCTHYHWIESDIKVAAHGHAEILQPEQAIISQLIRVLERLA